MEEMEPYFTTYPTAGWYWFDRAVYGEFFPKKGNLPTKDFIKLKKGGSGSGRRYTSRDEAIADYQENVK